MAFVRSGAASKVHQDTPENNHAPAADAGVSGAGYLMLTRDDSDEPIGMVLARCYRLARERARLVRNGQLTPVTVDLGGLTATDVSDDSTVKPDHGGYDDP